MRLLKRLAFALIPALALVAAFPLTAAAAPVAPATPTTSRNATVHGGQHLHVFKSNGKPVGKTTGQFGSASDLNYHGGRVLHDPQIYVIFWGSSWNSGTDATAKQTILNFFNDVGYTGYNNVITQYYDSTRINGDIRLAASTVDTNFAAADTSCGGPTVYDSDIYNEAANVAQARGWPLDSANGIYFVYPPAGSYVNIGGVTPCSDTPDSTGQGYCAYHGNFYTSNPSVTFAYSAMPYPVSKAGCGTLPSYPNGSSTNYVGDAEVNVSSHEMSEAITDPDLNAWFDSSGNENGDLCAWIWPTSNSGGNTYLRNGSTFTMQLEYSNDFSSCQNFARTWYFAEGYTGTGFTEYLTLENPTKTAANVVIHYLLQGGSPVVHSTTVNANARKTINVNTDLGTGQSVSMVVTSDQPIVAERPMYFTYTGLSGYTIPGGTDVLGLTQLQTQFNFGYLDTNSGHDTYLTVLNPNNSTMNVSVSYYHSGGGAPVVRMHSYSANSRGTIRLNNEGLGSGTFGAVVTLSAPGMVERPMYLQDSSTGNTGSTDVVGNVTGGLTTWNFAEGYTNTNFAETYYLFNPGGSATSATVTFYRTDGTTASQTVTVPAGGLNTVSANTVLGNGVNNSAAVTSNAPIIAERYMNFHYTGAVGGSTSSSVPGASDVMGAQYLGYDFQFAEGYTGTNFAEYLTLENPGTTTANVTVHYFVQGGGTTTETYQVGAHSRKTVFTNNVVNVGGASFSMDVASDQLILAERPMYFNYNGSQTGGSDVIGFVPPTAA